MKTELLHLTNRQELPEGAYAAGETIQNVQICPFGDFPNGDRQQHCTVEALKVAKGSQNQPYDNKSAPRSRRR